MVNRGQKVSGGWVGVWGLKRMRGHFKKMAARRDLGGLEVKGHAMPCPLLSPFYLVRVPFPSFSWNGILSTGGE